MRLTPLSKAAEQLGGHAATHRETPENAMPILRATGLTKRFYGFVAVDNVNLSVRRGSVHALIGPNGAGKTTVFNLLSGFLMPTQGRVEFEGADITQDGPVAIARRGNCGRQIRRGFQRPCRTRSLHRNRRGRMR